MGGGGALLIRGGGGTWSRGGGGRLSGGSRFMLRLDGSTQLE